MPGSLDTSSSDFLFHCFYIRVFDHNQLLNHSFTLRTLLTCATRDDLIYTRIRYVLSPSGMTHVYGFVLARS